MRHVPARFQILRRLGAGGFGIVYEALDRERGARVALKTLARVNASALYRFKREFRALADVAHDNLVRLHDLIGGDGEWFFTMELVRGVDWLTYVRGQDAAAGAAPSRGLTSTAPPEHGIDLDATLEDEDAPGAPRAGNAACPEARADLGRVRSSLVQVARALCVVHEARLVHRDLKPSNVLVTPEGRAVVLDFGIATHLTYSGQNATDAEQLVGTPLYMAPEQVGAGAVTPSADWYALGVMLFEALAGRPPFTGTAIEVLAEKQRSAPPDLRDVAPWVPDDLADLTRDLLRVPPEQRPSGIEVIRRLGAAGERAPAPRAESARQPEQGGQGASAARDAQNAAGGTQSAARDTQNAARDEQTARHDTRNAARDEQTAAHDAQIDAANGQNAARDAQIDAADAQNAARDAQIDALSGAVTAVREGRPSLVLVHGAERTGTSALVRAFLDREAEDALVLEGRCREREQVPYKALDGVIDALSRYLLRLPRPAASALMPRGAASLARAFPVLARVPAVSASPRSPGDEDDARIQARAAAALRDLLGRLSDRRPVIVFIDDAHWGDADSAALLAEIMASPDPAVLLLILAYRAGGAGTSPLLSALRGCPAMAAVHTVEIELT